MFNWAWTDTLHRIIYNTAGLSASKKYLWKILKMDLKLKLVDSDAEEESGVFLIKSIKSGGREGTQGRADN